MSRLSCPAGAGTFALARGESRACRCTSSSIPSCIVGAGYFFAVRHGTSVSRDRIPEPGEYVTTLSATVRSSSAPQRRRNHALVNRCVHKGSIICHQPKGKRTRAHTSCALITTGFTTSTAISRRSRLKKASSKKAHDRRLRQDPTQAHTTQSREDQRSSSARSARRRGTQGLPRTVMVEHIERTLHARRRYWALQPDDAHTTEALNREQPRQLPPSLLHAFFSTFKLNRLSARRHPPDDRVGTTSPSPNATRQRR